MLCTLALDLDVIVLTECRLDNNKPLPQVPLIFHLESIKST